MTDKPTQELKPCPFCAGVDIHAGRGSPVRPVMCKTCGATANDATAWNQRSGDATELLGNIADEAAAVCAALDKIAAELGKPSPADRLREHVARADAYLEGEER